MPKPRQSVVKHDGVIARIADGRMTVRIEVQSACGSCHARQSCLMAEREVKELMLPDTGGHQIGDSVVVVMRESLGFQAVFLGYLWPVVIVVTALIAFSCVIPDERIAGLMALAMLLPYYLALLLFRDKIQKHFTFSLED